MVLPKKVREELALQPGDTMELVSDGQQVILRPSRGQARMRKDRGVWVFHSGSTILPGETDQVLEEIRNSRNQQ